MTQAHRICAGNPRTQHQPQGLRHEHDLDADQATHRKRLRHLAFQASLGQDHCLRRAQLAQQRMGDYLAEQIDALVLRTQEIAQGAVAVTQLAQQVLGFELAKVQFAEQIEQR